MLEIKYYDTNRTNTTETRKLRKEKTGLVTSDKMDKTIVVSVERRIKHPSMASSLKEPPSSLPMMKRTKPIQVI